VDVALDFGVAQLLSVALFRLAPASSAGNCGRSQAYRCGGALFNPAANPDADLQRNCELGIQGSLHRQHLQDPLPQIIGVFLREFSRLARCLSF